jgi:hypothetical protein
MAAAGAKENTGADELRKWKTTIHSPLLFNQQNRRAWLQAFALELEPSMILVDWTATNPAGEWLVAPNDARELLMGMSGIALNNFLRQVGWTTTGQPVPDDDRVTQVTTDEAVNKALLLERVHYIVRLEVEQLLRQENIEQHHTMIAQRATMSKIVLRLESELKTSANDLKTSVERNTRYVQKNVALTKEQRAHEAKEAETNAQVQTLLLERANMLQSRLVLEEELGMKHAAALKGEAKRTVEVQKLRTQLLTATRASQATTQQVDKLTDEVQRVNNLLLASRDQLATVSLAHRQETDIQEATIIRLREENETQRLLLLCWNR